MTTKAGAKPARKQTSEIFAEARSFSSFSVNDLQKAKEFYGQKLGLDVAETEEGLELKTGDNAIFVYPKPNHTPASFTVLNFPVADIEAAVDELNSLGIKLEHYDRPEVLDISASSSISITTVRMSPRRSARRSPRSEDRSAVQSDEA